MPCLASLGWFHLQHVVEAVKVVEEADCSCQFDDLAFVVMVAQFRPERIVHILRAQSFTLSQFQRCLFGL